MKWFKHNAMASYADDLVLIRTELGFAGLGVYWQMMEMLSLHRGRCSMQLILSLKCKAFSAQKIRRVIELATALTEDQLGFLCLAKDEQDANRESCPDFAQSVFSEQNSPRRARIEENREIEIEKEEEEEKPAADDDFSKEKSQDTGRDNIDSVRKWLLDERNRVWREPMMMRSGYSTLLSRFWPQAVEYFVSHLLAQDKHADMLNEHDTRQYFSNFSKISVASGRGLMQHLSALTQQQGATTGAGSPGPPLPPGAPPRPSPTAVWNYATDSWTELRSD